MSVKAKQFCLRFSLLLCFMLLFQCGFSQNKFAAADEWLKENLTELGGRAVLVIFKDGKIIYNHAENNLSRKQKIIGKIIAKRKGGNAEEILQDFTSSTRERIASCSKWLSAALVMTFVDEGKLSLEDSIGKYLPVMTANGKGNIKIWQCLSHLTGIKSGTLKESLEEMKNINSMDEAIAKIAALPMEGEAGKTFHYSNTGLQIAGAVIEKISGKSFETLFAERIAKPCGMIHTDFGNKKVALPAGGAFSTADDYIHFLQMILNKGLYDGQRILSENAVTKMQINYAHGAVVKYSPAEAGNWGYGFGEWTMNDNQKRSAVTSPGLFGSFPWVENDKKYTAILFCFYLKSKGRNERYHQLKSIVDAAIN